MDRFVSSVILILLFVGLSAAQEPAKPHTAKAAPAIAPMPDAPSAESSDSGLPSEDTVNSFLKQMFGYDPGLTWKILAIKPSEAQGLTEITVALSSPKGQEVTRLYVTPDMKHAVTGDIIPFGAQPFAPDRAKLESGINGVSRGPKDAPAVLVEFSDLQCPHCKEAQPTLDKLMSEEPQARLVFQNYPLPIHDWAAKAAAYADCVGRTSGDAFWKFVHGAYDAQADITAANADEKLTAIADAAGVKGADIAACAAKPDTTARVEHSVALGKSVGVTGTPTLFVNGRKIANLGGLPYEILKQLVDFAAKEGQAGQTK